MLQAEPVFFPAFWRIMNADQDMQQQMLRLKGRIAQVYAQREQLKQALEQGAVAPRVGFQQLELTDRELSELDTRFKSLWDDAHGKAATHGAPASGVAAHPAADWAERTTLEPMHLDCVTAIMLKILDGKCKMGDAQKAAITVVYDVVKDRPGQGFDAEVHAHIAAARQAQDQAYAPPIHTWRLKAEAHIPKPVMKGFKQLLRASLPMPATP